MMEYIRKVEFKKPKSDKKEMAMIMTTMMMKWPKKIERRQ